jgi:hypothetical protein
MRHALVILAVEMMVAGTAIWVLRLSQPNQRDLKPMTTVDHSLPCTNPPQRGLMPVEYSCEGP